jgi:CheY-like chemotaxis protein
MPLRVLVVDDESDVRMMLRIQLEHHDGIEIVGEASDGRDALEKIASVQPDAVVMDLLMPRMSGIEAIQVMREECRSVAVVAYTATAGEFVRQEMARMNVPLLLKSGDIEPLVQALLATRAAPAPNGNSVP